MRNNIVFKILRILLTPFRNKRDSRHTTVLCAEFCKGLSDSRFSYSCFLRPKDPSIIPSLTFSGFDCSVAIVLQGPLRIEDHYTITTVKYYKQNYPDMIVIVSTWEDEDENELREIEKAGAVVVQSRLPSYSGQLNTNYQMVNTKAGMLKAKSLGAKYICKSRTDQRLERKHIFEFLISIMEMFPSECEKQVERLVVLSMNYGNLFYPYFMSDFFYFGRTEDVLKVFDIPLDSRPGFHMESGASRRMCSQALYAPETYFIKNYLDKIGHKCEFTVKDYWDAVKKYFICIDRYMLNLSWPKYDGYFEMHSFWGDYWEKDSNQKLKTENFTFINWFNLYSGKLIFHDEYEKYADEEF